MKVLWKSVMKKQLNWSWPQDWKTNTVTEYPKSLSPNPTEEGNPGPVFPSFQPRNRRQLSYLDGTRVLQKSASLAPTVKKMNLQHHQCQNVESLRHVIFSEGYWSCQAEAERKIQPHQALALEATCRCRTETPHYHSENPVPLPGETSATSSRSNNGLYPSRSLSNMNVD